MHTGAGYDAIVLAGGEGRRLGRVDKAAVEVGGRSLIDRVLRALDEAGRVVVVGPPRRMPPGVLGISERPPGGGPAAGVAAGLTLVEAPAVAVLACDLPFVTVETIRLLMATLEDDAQRRCDGVQLVDEAGRQQPLAAVYRTAPLREAVASLPHVAGSPMRALVQPLTMLDVRAPPAQAWDCDTWADLDRARTHANRHLVEEP